jgi:hypothetical protein
MFQERASDRYEVVIEGKIMSPDLADCLGCVIRNVSDGGALVAIDEGVDVPDRIYLWQQETGTTIACEVRWRKPGHVGLKFADPHAPAVRALTRICTPASRQLRPLPVYAPRRSVTMPSPAASARYLAEAY